MDYQKHIEAGSLLNTPPYLQFMFVCSPALVKKRSAVWQRSKIIKKKPVSCIKPSMKRRFLIDRRHRRQAADDVVFLIGDRQLKRNSWMPAKTANDRC